MPYVAGGIGITPLLAHLSDLDMSRVKLFWTIKVQDIGLVLDTFKQNHLLEASTTLFISAVRDDGSAVGLSELRHSQATVETRRITASDIQKEQSLSDTWYICAGKALRKLLLSWLNGKEVLYEDFDY